MSGKWYGFCTTPCLRKADPPSTILYSSPPPPSTIATFITHHHPRTCTRTMAQCSLSRLRNIKPSLNLLGSSLVLHYSVFLRCQALLQSAQRLPCCIGTTKAYLLTHFSTKVHYHGTWYVKLTRHHQAEPTLSARDASAAPARTFAAPI
jgi:hypothetical protein